MSRLGGITYARVTEGLELPRPDWKETLAKHPEVQEKFVKPKAEGQ
jgi:hypothetical protein